MPALHIPQPVYYALRVHAEEAYPRECCGVLLGQAAPHGWLVYAAVHATNIRADAAHNRYAIAPTELVRILHQARAQQLEIAGFYHSHPNHSAQWSAADLAEAHWLGCCYVITSVALGHAAETAAWLLAGAGEEDKHFVQLPLHIATE